MNTKHIDMLGYSKDKINTSLHLLKRCIHKRFNINSLNYFPYRLH